MSSVDNSRTSSDINFCRSSLQFQPAIELKAGGLNGSMKDFASVLELIMENVYSGIILCDSDSRILYMNRFYGELLGTDKNEAVGRHIKKYFPSSRIPSVLESGKMEIGQRCSLRSNVALLVNRIPIKSGDETVGVVLQTIFKNHTEINELMERLNLLERELKYYKRGLDSLLSATYSFESILGNTRLLVEAKKMAAKYAKTDASVLVLGATGSGKELFAHAIHKASWRRNGSFVCVNCAAIPRELLESELFGYETGAFTGARPKGKAGKIELSHGGTLFLDEIGDLPLSAQAKLLRVLETKKIEKLGGLKTVKVDFRLVAATNRDLREMISRKEFRDDLFYRLNTMSVVIPSLSERPDDIPELVEHFLSSIERPGIRFSEDALKIMQAYPWPGNIRELKNVVLRAVSLAEGKVIGPEHLPPELICFKGTFERPRSEKIKPFSREMDRYEKELLSQAIKFSGGNMARTARVLGLSRSTLYEKCKKHNL